MTAVDHVVLGAGAVGLAIAQDQSPGFEFGLQAASIAAAQNAWS